tara:strand:+ start:1140 stop:1451 length:312 start_codon:yes stop_codon:yes gene_type:complete
VSTSIFCPVNRHILIKPLEDSEEDSRAPSGILLPEDYQKQQSQHVAVSILDWAEDCSINSGLSEFGTALVERSMIKELSYEDEKVYLILENYVVCMITTDPDG